MKSLLIAAGLALATTLAGCSTDGVTGVSFASYSARTDAGYRVPAIPISKVASKYRRQTVNYETSEKP
nr:L,D-transpeptidase [Pseudomonadota bacterium]